MSEKNITISTCVIVLFYPGGDKQGHTGDPAVHSLRL